MYSTYNNIDPSEGTHIEYPSNPMCTWDVTQHVWFYIANFLFFSIVSQPTQPWHDQVNPDLRQHLVKKL